MISREDAVALVRALDKKLGNWISAATNSPEFRDECALLRHCAKLLNIDDLKTPVDQWLAVFAEVERRRLKLTGSMSWSSTWVSIEAEDGEAAVFKVTSGSNPLSGIRA